MNKIEAKLKGDGFGKFWYEITPNKLSTLIEEEKKKAYQEGKKDGRKPYVESNRKTRKRYANNNLCRVCGKGPLTVGTLCEKHKKIQNEKQRRYLAKKANLQQEEEQNGRN